MNAAVSLPVQYARRSVAPASIVSAHRAPAAAFTPEARKSAAKKLGLKFQKTVEKHLVIHHGSSVELQPHFRFTLSSGRNESCFPDAIVDLTRCITIIEIKLRHTYDGYVQLTRLYLPVVQKVYTGVPLRRLEICKSYDPAVKLPETSDVFTRRDLTAWLEKDRAGDYGVCIWGR